MDSLAGGGDTAVYVHQHELPSVDGVLPPEYAARRESELEPILRQNDNTYASEATPLYYEDEALYSTTTGYAEELLGDEPVHVSKDLTMWRLVAITYFAVAGGPFGLEGVVKFGGPLWALIGILVVPFVWALPVSLITAELSTMIPETGGYIVWMQRAFGPYGAFMLGFWRTFSNIVDAGLYPGMFLDYVLSPIDDRRDVRFVAGVFVIVVMMLVNTRGVGAVGGWNILMFLLTVLPFVVLIVMAAPSFDASVLSRTPAVVNWSSLLTVLLWNNFGYDAASTVAGEVQEPTRVYFRSLITTILLVAIVYAAPVMFLTCVKFPASASWDDFFDQWDEGFFVDIAHNLGGAGMQRWLQVAAGMGSLGLFNASLCASSHALYGMAAYNLAPSAFNKLHKRYRTPYTCIIFICVCCAPFLIFDFDTIVEMDVVLYNISLVMEVAAFFRLRIVEPRTPRPFKIDVSMPALVVMVLPTIAIAIFGLATSSSRTLLMIVGGFVVSNIAWVIKYYWLDEDAKEQ